MKKNRLAHPGRARFPLWLLAVFACSSWLACTGVAGVSGPGTSGGTASAGAEGTTTVSQAAGATGDGTSTPATDPCTGTPAASAPTTIGGTDGNTTPPGGTGAGSGNSVTFDENTTFYASYCLRTPSLLAATASTLDDNPNVLIVVFSTSSTFCDDLNNQMIAPNSQEIDVQVQKASLILSAADAEVSEQIRTPQVDSYGNTYCAAPLWSQAFTPASITTTMKSADAGTLTVRISPVANAKQSPSIPSKTIQATATACSALVSWPAPPLSNANELGCTTTSNDNLQKR